MQAEAVQPFTGHAQGEMPSVGRAWVGSVPSFSRFSALRREVLGETWNAMKCKSICCPSEQTALDLGGMRAVWLALGLLGLARRTSAVCFQSV